MGSSALLGLPRPHTLAAAPRRGRGASSARRARKTMFKSLKSIVSGGDRPKEKYSLEMLQSVPPSPLPASPSTCALSSDRLAAALPSVLLVPRCAECIDFRAAAGLCGWRRAARRVCARLRLSRPQRQRRRLGAPEPRRRPTPRRAHSVRRASGRSTVPYGRPATPPDGRWLARWQQGMTLTANSSIIPS